MNHNHKVITYVITVAITYFTLSFFANEVAVYVPSFKNVALFADITTQSPVTQQPQQLAKNTFTPKPKLIFSTFEKFENYTDSNAIIDFDGEKQSLAWQKLAQKLFDLSQNKKTKIRIAWLGDSQIEGDLITQDIRKMLQSYFGNQKGVGFLPLQCVSSDLRATAATTLKGNFTPNHFKKNVENGVFLSGYSYFSPNLNVFLKDRIQKDSTQIVEKWLLYGKGNPISIVQNGKEITHTATNHFNRILLDKSTSNSIAFSGKFPSTPVYGVSFEPESGIVVDNLSFRGITGVELKSIQNELLQKLNEENYYDLVVFQYGVNMMFRAKDTNYDYYHKIMTPVLQKFKTQMPNPEYLVFSCSDRAFNYDGVWESAIGIDSLVKVQARLAFENKMPFYNLLSSMGGKGTMKKWCDTIPKLANKDYIHFNHRGAKVVAQIITKALLDEFKKAIDSKRNQLQKKLKTVHVKEKSNA